MPHPPPRARTGSESASEGESGGVAFTPAHACSNKVFPKERVVALRSRLQQRSVSQGENQGVALTPETTKCFPGRESGRCAHACNNEVFPKERVEALRSHLLMPVATKCFLGRESGRCAHACSSEVFPRERVRALQSRL